MPKVKMLVDVSGTRDGKDWPRRGELAEVSADEAEYLLGAGLALKPSEPLEVEDARYVNTEPPAAQRDHDGEGRVESKEIPPTVPGEPRPAEADSDKRLADAEAEDSNAPTPETVETPEDAAAAEAAKAPETTEARKAEKRPSRTQRKG